MPYKIFTIITVCLVILVGCGSNSSEEQTQTDATYNGNKNNTQLINDEEETADEQKNVQLSPNNSVTKQSDETAESKSSKAEEPTEKAANTNKNENKAAESSEESQAQQQATEEQQEEQPENSGFSVIEGNVVEADSIPQADKESLLRAFHEYIDAFNKKDLARYKAVLASHPEGFDLEEDLQNTEKIFNAFDVDRQVKNVTITSYSANQAYVYADIAVEVKQNGGEAKDEGKQLTQFVKESSGWKVTSLQAIGSAANNQ